LSDKNGNLGSLGMRVNDLLSALTSEHIDEKVLRDFIVDAFGRDLTVTDTNKFRFDWRGKSTLLSLVQRPPQGALHPDIPASVDFDSARHIAIEGENLEVMKLIERSYFGTIKMIYMNPPFNIDQELMFDDRDGHFDRYMRYVAGDDVDGSVGIPAGSGHSAWLNLIYARLFVARNLLSNDGVIFVSIDDHEAHHLRMVMDEIFGEENFVACFVWEKRYSPPPDAKDVGYVHENIMCYRRSDEFQAGLLPMTDEQSARYTNQDDDPRGPWKAADYTCRYTANERPNLYYPVTNPKTGEERFPKPTRVWACSRAEHENNVEEGRLWWGVDGTNSLPAKKKYLFEIRQGAMPKTILQHDEVGHTDEATKELRKHLPELKLSSKPTKLMKHLLSIANVQNDDVVLDCYAGTGVVGEAILSLEAGGEQAPSFIVVEFPERLEEHDLTLSEAMLRRLRSSLTRTNSSAGFRTFRLSHSSFRRWDGAIEGDGDLLAQIERHVENIDATSDRYSLLFELLLSTGLPLSTPFKVVDLAGKQVFSVNDGALLICLEKEITLGLIDALAKASPSQVICLDAGFKSNDQLKANAVQAFRARAQIDETEIVFKTV
jgi:adenine-specific DNA-methyltransferase